MTGRLRRHAAAVLAIGAASCLSAGAGAAGISYRDELKLSRSYDGCDDAVDAVTQDECITKGAQELQRYEVGVAAAARAKVADDKETYERDYRAEFARRFDGAEKLWRRAIELECRAAADVGNPMSMASKGSTIETCIYDRTDRHIRNLIDDYDLGEQFGPLPGPN
jgi:hypothetical protein